MESRDSESCDQGAVMWATLSCIEPLTTGTSVSNGKLAAASFAGKNEQYIVKSNEFADGSSFSLMSETFVLGRASSCNLSIRYNKLVSGKHCRILKSDGIVWSEDTSTNGTLVNKSKKVMKDKILLNHGDIFHLVYKNSEVSENLGFKFELIGIEEEEPTQQYEDDIDQEITPVKEIQAERESQKRGASPSASDSVHRKKLNLEKDETRKEEEEEEDEMGDTLVCIICQDIFYDCVSLQPCMHSFCSGCYSEWMATSNECPCCRLKVERISKNHLVNNLVESYLKKNPLKKRSESDMKELDNKNKITHDMLYKRQVSSGSGSRASTPASSTGSPSPTPPAMIVNYNPALAAGIYNSANVISFGARRTICRQCPQPLASQDSTGSSCGASCAAPGPSACADPGTNASQDQPADGATATPTAPAYVCVHNQNHILCMCCLQAMPDRRAQRVQDQTIPPQQCSICYRFHCHAYWTCPKADCLGCLGKFSEMNFGRKSLTSILLDNRHESDILKNYLDNKGLGVNDMLRECITKMQAGEYSSTDSNRGALTADTVLCYKCGYRNLQELAYHYRVGIADADLPAAVTSRAKCYWGKGCRTQKHKPHHAANFSHICDASRTGS